MHKISGLKLATVCNLLTLMKDWGMDGVVSFMNGRLAICSGMELLRKNKVNIFIFIL